MPDLQSELAKVLSQTNFDDEPDTTEPATVIDTTTPTTAPPGRPTQENSKRRTVWNFIRANAMSTVVDVAKATGLPERFCYGTISALLRYGRLTRKQINGLYCYSVISDNYEDRLLKKDAKPAKKPKKVVKPLTEIKRDLGLPPTPAPAPTPTSKAFDPDAIINQLNVLQAKELMVRLKQVFGEIA